MPYVPPPLPVPLEPLATVPVTAINGRGQLDTIRFQRFLTYLLGTVGLICALAATGLLGSNRLHSGFFFTGIAIACEAAACIIRSLRIRNEVRLASTIESTTGHAVNRLQNSTGWAIGRIGWRDEELRFDILDGYGQRSEFIAIPNALDPMTAFKIVQAKPDTQEPYVRFQHVWSEKDPNGEPLDYLVHCAGAVVYASDIKAFMAGADTTYPNGGPEATDDPPMTPFGPMSGDTAAANTD